MPKPKQENHLRLKKPCANCPFKKEGAIELAPGRLEGIINDIGHCCSNQGTIPQFGDLIS
ncbi:TPA: hypothetical protein MH391_21585 [Klebsiella pneumoniae]|nr:hypothetical protein [Klebsiella pneumoniae]